jgi:hypothetical protein
MTLEEACRAKPHGGDRDLRKQPAQKLVACASEGNTNLGESVDVARAALTEATRKRPQPSRPKLIQSLAWS